MRVVSETSPEELARREKELAHKRAKDILGGRLRELTANLLRITRGAGKPYNVGRDLMAVVESYREYRDKFDFLPDAFDIADELNIRREPGWYERFSEENQAIMYAEDAVVRGAMQMVASKLLGQSTQETRGQHEMYEGINAILREREAERLRSVSAYQAKQKAERAARAAKRKAKAKPKKPANTMPR